jgi:hypothetical protein
MQSSNARNDLRGAVHASRKIATQGGASKRSKCGTGSKVPTPACDGCREYLEKRGCIGLNCLADVVTREREGWTLVVDVDAEAPDFEAARALADQWLTSRGLRWDDFDPRTDWEFMGWYQRGKKPTRVYEVWLRDEALRAIESGDSC